MLVRTINLKRKRLSPCGLGFPMVTLTALTGYGPIIGERLLTRNAPDLVTVSAEARHKPAFATKGVLHIHADRPVNVETHQHRRDPFVLGAAPCGDAGCKSGPCERAPD